MKITASPQFAHDVADVPAALHADATLCAELAAIDGTAAAEGETSPGDQVMTQARADTLLATIAWCRLAEPSDLVAGALLSVFGAQGALAMLVRGVTARELQRCLTQTHTQQQAAPLAELSERAAREALARWLPRLDRGATIADIATARAAGLKVVLPGDARWPVKLNDLQLHAPHLLWVRGALHYLCAPSLSVVGARAVSGYGSHITAEIVDGVCARGLAIVSGAAYGVDAVAHRTALAVGAPTIAVLAGGADRPYPQAHTALLDSIAGAGVVCSEMLPGSAPTRWRFLQRNRLIAALSDATLVTEAGLRSGSLNTAGHAAQLGRALGAVPGQVTSAASAGCHRLIREYAATLVTNAQEACELLGMSEAEAFFGTGDGSGGGGVEASAQGVAGTSAQGSAIDAVTETLSELGQRVGAGLREGAWERRVLDALPLRGMRTVAEIAKTAGLTVEQVGGVLAELELLGMVRRRTAGGEAPAKWALQRRQ